MARRSRPSLRAARRQPGRVADRGGPHARHRVPDDRRPHRQPQPADQAAPRRRAGRLPAARRRGVRRRAAELVARPRSRTVRAGGPPRRDRPRGAPAPRRSADLSGSAAGDPPRSGDHRQRLAPQRAAAPQPDLGARRRHPRRVRGLRRRPARRGGQRHPRLGPHAPRRGPQCGHRCGRRAHQRSPPGQPLLLVGGTGSPACRGRRGCERSPPGAAARAVRPRGDRLHLEPRRRVGAPARHHRADRPGPRRRPRGPPASARGLRVLFGRHGPRHPPELRRPARARAPDRLERRSRAQGEQQRPLRQRRVQLGELRARLRAGRRAAPALRPPQRPPLRLHDRPHHCGRDGRGHRRHRRTAARDALGPRALWRGRPGPLHRSDDRVPRRPRTDDGGRRRSIRARPGSHTVLDRGARGLPGPDRRRPPRSRGR